MANKIKEEGAGSWRERTGKKRETKVDPVPHRRAHSPIPNTLTEQLMMSSIGAEELE